MYTRTRQTPGYANVRNQSTPNIGYQGQNTYNQPGGFQGTQPSSSQQSNYNQGSVRNPQSFKPQQPQPQQQPQMQQVATRNLQGKPQQPQMQLPPPRNLQQGTSHQLLQQIKQAQQPLINSPQIQPQPQPQSQSQPQPQPQPQSQPQPQQQPQPQSQPQPQAQPQSQPQSQPQALPQSQPQPQSQPLPQTQTQTQSQPQAQSQPQTQPQSQSQSQSQSQPQSQSQNQPQRLKPILKQPSHIQQQTAVTVQNNPVPSSQSLVPIPTSPLTANSNPTPPINKNISEIKNESQVSENADIEVQEQHPRWRRKAPGFRVNKRLKRLRLNQRLKKTLQPKNAIMVLNEMKPGVQFTFPETQGPMSNSLYLVHAELDGKTYVGQGLSKPLARQNAAENALKALLLEKMTAASMKARIDAESDGQANQSSESSNIAKEDNNEETVTPMDVSVDESDEIPWSSLASFALYKLFLEWHNQGTSVPVPRPGLPSPAKGMKREISHVQKTPVQKELPSNATNIHPVMLLNQMRPGLTYVELNRVGNPPNTMFTLAVDIDDVEYTGTAKNKKDAKKIAAKSALLALYGLNYPDEVKPVPQDQAVA